jgi:hypothetical protein
VTAAPVAASVAATPVPAASADAHIDPTAVTAPSVAAVLVATDSEAAAFMEAAPIVTVTMQPIQFLFCLSNANDVTDTNFVMPQ